MVRAAVCPRGRKSVCRCVRTPAHSCRTSLIASAALSHHHRSCGCVHGLRFTRSLPQVLSVHRWRVSHPPPVEEEGAGSPHAQGVLVLLQVPGLRLPAPRVLESKLTPRLWGVGSPAPEQNRKSRQNLGTKSRILALRKMVSASSALLTPHTPHVALPSLSAPTRVCDVSFSACMVCFASVQGTSMSHHVGRSSS